MYLLLLRRDPLHSISWEVESGLFLIPLQPDRGAAPPCGPVRRLSHGTIVGPLTAGL
jgi:hypothetical protein